MAPKISLFARQFTGRFPAVDSVLLAKNTAKIDTTRTDQQITTIYNCKCRHPIKRPIIRWWLPRRPTRWCGCRRWHQSRAYPLTNPI